MVLSASVAWQAHIQNAPHLYVPALIALVLKGIIIPVALHRVVIRLGIHRGIEGLCVDSAANVIACAGWQRSGPGPLVYVFSPAGVVLETHPLPADLPLNCAFGDTGLTSLYVSTAAGHLFRAKSTGRTGHLLYPQH